MGHTRKDLLWIFRKDFRSLTQDEQDELLQLLVSYDRTVYEEAFLVFLYEHRPYNWWCSLTFKRQVPDEAAKSYFKIWLWRLKNALSTKGIKDCTIKYVLVGPRCVTGHLHMHAFLFHPALDNIDCAKWQYKWKIIKPNPRMDARYRVRAPRSMTGDNVIERVYSRDVLGYMSKNIRNYPYNSSSFFDDNLLLFPLKDIPSPQPESKSLFLNRQ